MGKVYLIGAGPGAADLITVRGARLVGQRAGGAARRAGRTGHARLRAATRARSRWASAAGSVRPRSSSSTSRSSMPLGSMMWWCALKGGDPMLFGRADEEMRALEAAGIEYEVVPGITAALASAATLKRSLTLRGVARSVALATYSRAPDAMKFASRRARIRWCSTWAATVRRRLRSSLIDAGGRPRRRLRSSRLAAPSVSAR